VVSSYRFQERPKGFGWLIVAEYWTGTRLPIVCATASNGVVCSLNACWAHPVISDGRLYVRNQDTLLV
jgi:hypothetical protein